MRARLVTVLAGLLLSAAALPVAAQEPSGPLEIEQETEDHYVVLVRLPASLFKQTPTELELPVPGLDLQADGEGDAYRLRLEVKPHELRGDGATLKNTIWEVQAVLEGPTGDVPLPSLAGIEGHDPAPTREGLQEQIDTLVSEADTLLAQVGGATGELPDEAPSTVHEAATLAREEIELARALLQEASDSLEPTIDWLGEPVDEFTGDLEPTERALRLAAALLTDAETQLTAAGDALPTDLVEQRLEQAFTVAEQRAEWLSGRVEATRGLAAHYAEVAEHRANERADWLIEVADPDGRLDTARELAERVQERLGSEAPDGGEATPPDPPYDTLREQFEVLEEALSGPAPSTSQEVRETLELALETTEETLELIGWAKAWLDEGPPAEADGTEALVQDHVDRARQLLESAERDLEEVNATLHELAQDPGVGLPAGSGDPLQDAQGAIDGAVAELEEATQGADQAPDDVEQGTSRPTEIRVLIPKDPTTLLTDPALPDEDVLGGGETGLPTGEATDGLGLAGDEDGDQDGDDDSDESGEGDGSGDGDGGDGDGATAALQVTTSTTSMTMKTGDQRTLEVTVENTGEATDTVQLTAEHNGPFTVDTVADASATLDPGETETFQLRISPTGTGEGTLTVRATSDGGAQAARDVSVTVEQAQRQSDADLDVDLDPAVLTLTGPGTGTVRVVVSNHADASDQVSLTVSGSGPLEASLAGPSQVTVAPGDEEGFDVEITPKGTGDGSVSLALTSSLGAELNPVLLVDLTEDDASGDEGPPGTNSGQSTGAGADDGAGHPDSEAEQEKDLPLPGVLAVLALGLGALQRRRRP